MRADPKQHRFAHAGLTSAPTVLGPLAVEATVAGAPGLLLAGDAAGFIDPMTGDGLRFAFRGGELAAYAALRVLTTGWQDAHVHLARAAAANLPRSGVSIEPSARSQRRPSRSVRPGWVRRYLRRSCGAPSATRGTSAVDGRESHRVDHAHLQTAGLSARGGVPRIRGAHARLGAFHAGLAHDVVSE